MGACLAVGDYAGAGTAGSGRVAHFEVLSSGVAVAGFARSVQDGSRKASRALFVILTGFAGEGTG